ncbi:hypothetical protein P170DRAFT_102986 [Aspergillus steynii IBT 23096]|uniref:Uncharacterized protein n=1 Tax=Aspergillus steynii IBT 23096 TaxID=1392250 RepID=A0A2I2GHN7_9EURO|nr:uncharacterized protein P170DRAFT_102986 [Aspergillus steynii IBT 23096]PLB52390.1 hypothetical protein P170DRAFT_102986 [Aspergillus steynii IBT 23096]
MQTCPCNARCTTESLQHVDLCLTDTTTADSPNRNPSPDYRPRTEELWGCTQSPSPTKYNYVHGPQFLTESTLRSSKPLNLYPLNATQQKRHARMPNCTMRTPRAGSHKLEMIAFLIQESLRS